MNKTAEQIAADVLEKIAIDIHGARKAVSALKQNDFVRAAVGFNEKTKKVLLQRRRKQLPRTEDVTVAGPGAAIAKPKHLMDLEILPDSPAFGYYDRKLRDSALNLPGRRPHIFATGGAMDAPMQHFADEGMARHIREFRVPAHFTSQQRELFNRLSLLHEGMEQRAMRKLPWGRANTGQWGSASSGSHHAPEVLMEEGAMLASLPKQYAPVKDYFLKLRDFNRDGLNPILREYPGYEHGVTRLNRRTRNAVAEAIRSGPYSGFAPTREARRRIREAPARRKRMQEEAAARQRLGEASGIFIT